MFLHAFVFNFFYDIPLLLGCNQNFVSLLKFACAKLVLGVAQTLKSLGEGMFQSFSAAARLCRCITSMHKKCSRLVINEPLHVQYDRNFISRLLYKDMY